LRLPSSTQRQTHRQGSDRLLRFGLRRTRGGARTGTGREAPQRKRDPCICGTHLLLERAASDQIRNQPVISNWGALLNDVRLGLRLESSWQARLLFLDRKNKLIADAVVGRGAVDHAPVYPRKIARRALELAASAVILVDSQPSGDPTPSKADSDLTREIEKALKAPEIRLHDHLAVGPSETVSMKTKDLN